MSDDAARPDGPTRLVYSQDGSGMRLVEFADERGRKTRYTYDDARGVVTCWEADGSTAEYAVPPGRMLARTLHPETGAWVHVCLRAPSAADSERAAWPTQLRETTAEGATAARRVGGAPAPPRDRPACGEVSSVTYDSAMFDAPRPLGSITTFTYDRDDRLMSIQPPDGQVVTYTYDLDGRRLDPSDEA